jgi:hypothetical protein
LNKDQLNAALIALFASSGPVAKLLAVTFGLDNAAIEAILSMASIFTPLLIVPFFLRLMTPQRKIEDITNLSPSAAHEALSQVSDITKVRIAERVDSVATIIVKNGQMGAVGQAAASPANPNIINETQNVLDSKTGFQGVKP